MEWIYLHNKSEMPNTQRVRPKHNFFTNEYNVKTSLQNNQKSYKLMPK